MQGGRVPFPDRGLAQLRPLAQILPNAHDKVSLRIVYRLRRAAGVEGPQHQGTEGPVPGRRDGLPHGHREAPVVPPDEMVQAGRRCDWLWGHVA